MSNQSPPNIRRWQCKLCGTHTPVTEHICRNSNCQADLALHGEIFIDRKEPTMPTPKVLPLWIIVSVVILAACLILGLVLLFWDFKPAPVPIGTVPETTLPAETIPETIVPKITIPEITIPEVTFPEVIAPQYPLPDPGPPAEKTPGPETIVPETTVPEITLPEVIAPQNPLPALRPPAEKTPVPETTSVEMAWESNVLMSDPHPGGLVGYSGVLGSDIHRDQIHSVTFLDSLTNAPTDKWDVSLNQDGTVWTWTIRRNNKKMYDLYIAGEGGVNGCNSEELFFGYLNVKEFNFDGHFHTEHATSMSRMFAYCRELEELNLESFDTSNVESMWNMFKDCTSLSTLDLTSFETRSTTNIDYLISGCDNLEKLIVPNFTDEQIAQLRKNHPSLCIS